MIIGVEMMGKQPPSSVHPAMRSAKLLFEAAVSIGRMT